MSKRGLGKGLDALLSTSSFARENSKLHRKAKPCQQTVNSLN